MRVDPDDAEPARARRKPADRPEMRQQQPPRTSGRFGKLRICVATCSSSEPSSITAASG